MPNVQTIKPVTAGLHRPPLISIFLISAAALGYEILLMRLFSIIHWHHFAYMIISLALMGYGVSGTFITVARRWLVDNFTAAFVTNAALFGLTATTCFALAQRIPFNTLEILWDREQWLLLLLTYLLLFIPFFFAANGICLAFARFATQIPRIYSFDLLGAGAGALGIIGVLFIASPTDALRLLGAVGFVAAAIACFEGRENPRWGVGLLLLCGAASLGLLPDRWLALNMSEYKGLQQALRVSGARVVDERSSPLGLVTVIESPRIPLRHAPGLSLNSPVAPPPQLGVFTDGDGLTAIGHYSGDREALTYLDYLTSALPYHLGNHRRVLVLGAGGGSEVLQAIDHGAEKVDAVELNPQVSDLLQKGYADFSGWFHLKDRVTLHIAEARGFVAGSSAPYDLIQVALMDSSSAASSGLYALSESYLYTTEAIEEYLRHLRPSGLLAITRWVKLPPRDSLKLFATAISALSQSGIDEPGRRLAMIRGWKTSTLLIKHGAFTPADIVALRAFCDERSFDVAYYPGMTPQQANRYNVLERPYFFAGARALLGDEAEAFLADYKFQLAPATDDRPYFFQFFKWSSLPEILSLRSKGGLSLLELGYPVLLVTLVQAAVASVVLILLPLWFVRREQRGEGGVHAWRVVVYFLAIGLAFLFVEIAFIQKFILFLSHPLYTIAVVLCAFLIFAGLGSRYADRFQRRPHQTGPLTPLFWVVIVLSLIALAYLQLLPPLFQSLVALPDLAKIVVSFALIAPLAFCMGMPFPLGLSQLAKHAPPMVPWAWGINGCASVVSAILATLLAIHFGFAAVVIVALLLYLLAAWVMPAPGNT